MKTVITTINELKNIFLEILFSKTNKVSKVSDSSILNATAYANATIAQKSLQEIAKIEAQLFPEYANGEFLDLIAERYGIFERLGATPSSTYLYLYGNPGTIYFKDTSTFSSNEGVTFVLEDEQVEIPNCKYIYAKVRSQEPGKKTNVSPLSIVNCVNPPTGHLFCVNEFMATGGRDLESDEELIYRIKNINNTLGTKTLDFLKQIALRFNSNILKFVHLGSFLGKTRIGVYTQSGASLTQDELSYLQIQLQDYFALSDISDSNNSRIIFENISYAPIDMNFKIDYANDVYSVDEIYSAIQRKLISFLDFRFWDTNKNVQWGQLLDIVTHTEGVLTVPYADFKVNGGQNDIVVKKNLLPRFRSFLIYDLDGNIIIDTDMSDNMLPIIYPTYENAEYNIYFNQ